MVKMIDLTGQRFGRLVVLRHGGTATNGNAEWLCQCDCGNLTSVQSYNLRHGVTRSCGCLARELSRKRLAKQKALWNADGTHFQRDGVTYHQLRNNNSTGVVGVSRVTKHQLWVARLMVKGKLVLNQNFSRFSDAVEARLEAEREYLPSKAWQFVVFDHTPQRQTRHVTTIVGNALEE